MDASIDRNPQAKQMADESMVRNLAAQAQAIWPLEEPFLARYGVRREATILDLACGTGEITTRLAGLFPEARVVGLELLAASARLARQRSARAHILRGDAYALPLASARIDLVLCRHLLQAIPAIDEVLAEIHRVLAPGGFVHVIAEDYGLMHFHPTRRDTDRFWREGPMAFARAGGTDLQSGHKLPVLLAAAGFEAITIDYLPIDTLRVDRRLFADIWRAWRDGYADAIAAATHQPTSEVRAGFDDMIACLEDPHGYGVWLLPLVSGRRPVTPRRRP